MRDYLIYTSAGEAANVKQWHSSANRNYDIWVTNFSKIPLLNREYADYYDEHTGAKFSNFYYAFKRNSDTFSKYKVIMLADDDVIISPNSLSALFRLFQQRDFWIMQPAFSRFGKISHPITRRRIKTSLRYTNFVEITCPIFRTDKLIDILSIYDINMATATGLDYWFPYVLGIENQEKYAISDKYYCINPRDFFKPKGKRTIDLVSNQELRLTMVKHTLNKLGIKNFIYREYSHTNKSFLEVLISLPLFILEVIFNELWLLSSKFVRLVRKMSINALNQNNKKNRND